MDDVQFWWDGWEPLARILLVATLGYAALIALLRVTGARSLARMTPFDFVITVTIGSAFGRVLTATEVSVAEMLLTFVVLMALQWGVAVLRERVPAVHTLVDVEPVVLFHGGRYNRRALRRHRLLERDVVGAVRQSGHGSLEDVAVVVFESTGTFSVVPHADAADGDVLDGVRRP